MEEFDRISVLIADRYILFGHGLVGLLQEQRPRWLFSHAATLDIMLDQLQSEPTDLVLIDPHLPGLHGQGDIRRVRQLCPDQKLIVMSEIADSATILGCLASGVHGYVLKSTTMPQLLRAMDTVLSGGVFAPAALTESPFPKPKTPPGATSSPDLSPLLIHLTDRQREVFDLLAEGCATKTIARRLNLAVGTVKVHLAAVYRLLGAHNRVEALAKARGSLTHQTSAPATGDLFDYAD